MNDGLRNPGRRRSLKLGLAALPLLVAPWSNSRAQGGPVGPVRIVVPHSTGTTPDLIARLLGPGLADHFGTSFVVENRPGAAGVVGCESVARSLPDGRTLMLASANLATLPLMYKNLRFDIQKSFDPVANLVSNNFALIVHPSLQVQTFQEFVAYVKGHPKQLDYASPGTGTFHHLWMEQLSQQLGLQMVHVPYKGQANATADILAGHVNAMFLPIQIATPFADEKRVRMLGVVSKERDTNFPTIPTLAESGAPGFSGESWYAMFAPSGIAPSLAQRYEAQMHAILSSPKMKDTLAKEAIHVRSENGEQVRQLMSQEIRKWERLVKDSKLDLQTGA
ncbi:Bug family tripartite tricarboxylate transporter substrate binding protein [Cupriavidus pauculus]|uniref:Bug family tripartite tricarboxylate transporter substrate binding protein n=1 Tax=Cupriavidus pauculus TaxID=82633 RepID=UPI0030F5F21B